jgi:hypothetical protein
LITIKRTKLAIEIEGRPRSRALCSHAAAIGSSSSASDRHHVEVSQILGQFARLYRQHLVPQALHLPATQREHHTSNRSETNS